MFLICFCIWTQIRFGFYACVLMFWFFLYLNTDLIWFLRMCFDVLFCFVFGHRLDLVFTRTQIWFGFYACVLMFWFVFVFEHRLDLVFTHVFWCFDLFCIWTQIWFGFYTCVLMFWFVLYLNTDLIWFLRMCFDVLICFVFEHRFDLVFTHVFWCFDLFCIWTQMSHFFGFNLNQSSFCSSVNTRNLTHSDRILKINIYVP